MRSNHRSGKRKAFPVAAFLFLLPAVLLLVMKGIVYEPEKWEQAAGKENVFGTSVSDTGNSNLKVTFIDVGQGDSILIQCDGEAMLIDSGYAEYSETVLKTLKENGAESLRYLVITHPHADHCGGVPEILSEITVDKILTDTEETDEDEYWYFTESLKEAAEKKITVEVPAQGDTLTLGSAGLTVLGPVRTFSISDEEKDINNLSLVLRLDYGEKSFLFCGDCSYDEEQDILDSEYASQLAVDVLKVGHHGSSGSTSYRWLRAVTENGPVYAVISVGADNEYGHPTEKVLSLLKDADSTIMRTDQMGTIVCLCDGHSITWK